MVKFLAKLLSGFWFLSGKKVRRDKRVEIASWLYGRKIRRVAKSVGRHLTVLKPSTVTPATTIGDFSGMSDTHIHGAGEVVIGSHTFLSEGTLVFSQNQNYDTDTMLPFGHDWTLKPVHIDDCVWVGVRCIILPGTHIGEGAIIQAGSVVHGEIPPCAIAGGNPAKVFAYRNREHYDELRRQGRYTTG